MRIRHGWGVVGQMLFSPGGAPDEMCVIHEDESIGAQCKSAEDVTNLTRLRDSNTEARKIGRCMLNLLIYKCIVVSIVIIL